MKRYIISKYIKRTGHVIEGRGNTKAIAQKRFKAALAAFRKLDSQDKATHEVGANVFTRKRLVNTVLSRQNQ